MSFATDQLARIEALLAEHPAVQSWTIGNTSVSYAELKEEWKYWKRQVDLESGKRKRLHRIDLSNW